MAPGRLREILREYIQDVRPSLLQLGYGREILAYVATHGPVASGAVKNIWGKDMPRYLTLLHERQLLHRHGPNRRYQYTLAPKGARLLATGHSSPYVFVNAHSRGASSHRPDQPLTTKAIWRLVHMKLTPLVGRSVYPHALRHSFASRLRARGVDLALIQEAMGHESIATTMIYAHLATPARNAELARLLAEDTPGATPA